MELAEATERKNVTSEVAAVVRFGKAVASRILREAHVKGWGTEAALKEQFSKLLYLRDAMMMMFLPGSEVELVETLQTIFRYRQSGSGAMPYRVEKPFHKARLMFPRLFSFERPFGPVGSFDNRFLATPSRDTALLITIACGKIYRSSEAGRNFVRDNWCYIKRAIEREDRFIDPKDGMLVGKGASNWLDNINRPGKLADLNLMLYQAYREMAYMSRGLGYRTKSREYLCRSERVLDGIMKTLWDEENGYLWARPGDDHFDSCANNIALLVLPSSWLDVKTRIHASLEERVEGPMDMVIDFDRPYDRKQLLWWMRLCKVEKYGDPACYPWLTGLTCLAEIKLAQEHTNPAIAAECLKRATDRYISLAKLIVRDGTCHETYDPTTESLHPVQITKLGRLLYRSCPDFLAAASLYLAVHNKLIQMGVPLDSLDLH